MIIDNIKKTSIGKVKGLYEQWPALENMNAGDWIEIPNEPNDGSIGGEFKGEYPIMRFFDIEFINDKQYITFIPNSKRQEPTNDFSMTLNTIGESSISLGNRISDQMKKIKFYKDNLFVASIGEENKQKLALYDFTNNQLVKLFTKDLSTANTGIVTSGSDIYGIGYGSKPVIIEDYLILFSTRDGYVYRIRNNDFVYLSKYSIGDNISSFNNFINSKCLVVDNYIFMLNEEKLKVLQLTGAKLNFIHEYNGSTSHLINLIRNANNEIVINYNAKDGNKILSLNKLNNEIIVTNTKLIAGGINLKNNIVVGNVANIDTDFKNTVIKYNEDLTYSLHLDGETSSGISRIVPIEVVAGNNYKCIFMDDRVNWQGDTVVYYKVKNYTLGVKKAGNVSQGISTTSVLKDEITTIVRGESDN